MWIRSGHNTFNLLEFLWEFGNFCNFEILNLLRILVPFALDEDYIKIDNSASDRLKFANRVDYAWKVYSDPVVSYG